MVGGRAAASHTDRARPPGEHGLDPGTHYWSTAPGHLCHPGAVWFCASQGVGCERVSGAGGSVPVGGAALNPRAVGVAGEEHKGPTSSNWGACGLGLALSVPALDSSLAPDLRRSQRQGDHPKLELAVQFCARACPPSVPPPPGSTPLAGPAAQTPVPLHTQAGQGDPCTSAELGRGRAQPGPQSCWGPRWAGTAAQPGSLEQERPFLP